MPKLHGGAQFTVYLLGYLLQLCCECEPRLSLKFNFSFISYASVWNIKLVNQTIKHGKTAHVGSPHHKESLVVALAHLQLSWW